MPYKQPPKLRRYIMIGATVAGIIVLGLILTMNWSHPPSQQQQQHDESEVVHHHHHHQHSDSGGDGGIPWYRRPTPRKKPRSDKEKPSWSDVGSEKSALEDDAVLLANNADRINNRKSSNGELIASDVAAVGTCEDAKNCLQCLYRTTASSTKKCAWLAARSKCVVSADFFDDDESNAGTDAETTSCPAILFRTLPAKIAVIHVAIRKGGPEALVQMHLALAYWGFQTFLDTRRSKKQKGGPVVPFFRDMYKTEFARTRHEKQLRYFDNYRHWQGAGKEGEVLLATETWLCENTRTSKPGGGAFFSQDVSGEARAILTEPEMLRSRGVRHAQWHLTVWPRKPRSGCTIMSHTRYIAAVYMRTPLLALMFPYVSPHIVQLALEKSTPRGDFTSFEKHKSQSQSLLMYDGDVKMSAGAFNTKGTDFVVKKATGYTPQALYQEYQRASVCVDWELPGGERFIYESALFGCCAIVDRSLNGLDKEDFPLPDYLRAMTSHAHQPDELSSWHKKTRHRQQSAPSLHMAIGRCIGNHRAQTMADLQPLRTSILRQRVRFHRHVRRYFSNNVHVVTAVATAAEFRAHVVRFVVSTLVFVPFATIEVVMTPEAANAAPEVKAQLTKLLDHSYLAAVLWTVWKPSSAASLSIFDSTALLLGHVMANAQTVVTTNPVRAAYVAFLPVEAVISHRDFVNHLASVHAVANVVLASSEKKHVSLVGESFFFADTRSLSKMTAAVAMKCPAAKTKSTYRHDLVAAMTHAHACGGGDASSDGVTVMFIEDAEAQFVSNAEMRRHAQTPAALVAPQISSASGSTAMRFLCEHALFEELFPESCGSGAENNTD